MEKTGKSPSEIDRLNSEYWDKYYKSGRAPTEPSEFAKFCLPFMNKGEFTVDIGCGNGRDSVYLQDNGMLVCGWDKDLNAIYEAKINRKLQKSPIFLIRDIAPVTPNDDLVVRITNAYCRWIIHALTAKEENVLLNFISRKQKENDKLFIEVRSVNDELYGDGSHK